MVQALLIVQAYEKMFSTRKLHEMSHIFHYSVITVSGRNCGIKSIITQLTPK